DEVAQGLSERRPVADRRYGLEIVAAAWTGSPDDAGRMTGPERHADASPRLKPKAGRRAIGIGGVDRNGNEHVDHSCALGTIASISFSEDRHRRGAQGKARTLALPRQSAARAFLPSSEFRLAGHERQAHAFVASSFVASCFAVSLPAPSTRSAMRAD